MINGKSVLAIIPARGGSKGLPKKNTKNLCGKPLILWSIEKAKLSVFVDKLIVSTDSNKIAELSRDYDCEVPFIRPSYLAEDKTPMYKVVLHALDYYSKKNIEFDIVVLLEPTSPLREDDDIDKMLKKFDYNYSEYDAIISIGEVNEHPSIMKKIDDDCLLPFYENMKMPFFRQDCIPAYFPYGVAYISKVSTFRKEKTFYPERLTYYIIKRYQNYEIDSIYDFLAIENIIKYQWKIK